LWKRTKSPPERRSVACALNILMSFRLSRRRHESYRRLESLHAR
jgi:hypothetical protein